MADTLHDLGNLLLKSVPTVLFFIFLAYYLKAMLFRPLERILEERRKATEGVRELANQALAAADRKNQEFEYALHLVRQELLAQHEAKRREWAEEQAQKIAAARAKAEQQVEDVKRQVAGEREAAQAELDAQVEHLGQQITDTLVRRRAA